MTKSRWFHLMLMIFKMKLLVIKISSTLSDLSKTCVVRFRFIFDRIQTHKVLLIWLFQKNILLTFACFCGEPSERLLSLKISLRTLRVFLTGFFNIILIRFNLNIYISEHVLWYLLIKLFHFHKTFFLFVLIFIEIRLLRNLFIKINFYFFFFDFVLTLNLIFFCIFLDFNLLRSK